MPKKTYDYSKKKRLMEQIHSLNKKCHIEIFKIIKSSSKYKGATENSNGMHMRFNDLDINTYQKLAKYVKVELKKKKKKQKLSESEHEIFTNTSYAEEEFPNQKKMTSKLRYSNNERSILRRQRFENNNKSDDIEYVKFSDSVDFETNKKTKPNEKVSKKYSGVDETIEKYGVNSDKDSNSDNDNILSKDMPLKKTLIISKRKKTKRRKR
jgi:hypothetical protein